MEIPEPRTACGVSSLLLHRHTPHVIRMTSAICSAATSPALSTHHDNRSSTPRGGRNLARGERLLRTLEHCTAKGPAPAGAGGQELADPSWSRLEWMRAATGASTTVVARPPAPTGAGWLGAAPVSRGSQKALTPG